MNKKGFTLIELLAVIIIISLLTILVLPKITDSVKNYTKKTDALMLKMIEDAVKLYVEDNEKDFPKKINNSYCVPINELVDKDYLKDNIEYEGKKIVDTKTLQITYNNGYSIKLVDNNSCIEYRDICKPVTNETKTTGNIPDGSFRLGDEYICEVKPNVEYHFFVLSVKDDKVNLILDRNINSDGTLATEAITKENSINGVYSLVEWISVDDYASSNIDNTVCSENACSDEGPVTAMTFLENATSSWSSIPNLNETHTEEIYGIINLTGKARLGRLTEISNAGCGPSSGTCPLWMVNYMSSSSQYSTMEGLNNISKMGAYWILSSLYSTSARAVESSGYWSNNIVLKTYGIRPVITLPSTSLTIQKN